MNNICKKRISNILLCAVLCLTACRPAYEVTEVKGSRVTIDSTWDTHPHAEMAALVADYKARVDSVMNRVLGTAALPMEAKRPESLLSNLVADVLKEAAGRLTEKQADMGLVNMGGLRSTLAEGTIVSRHIYEILPFENSLCLLTMKGTDLMQLFREIAYRRGEGVSGVKLEITADGQLLKATIGGKPVDENRNYTVATIDYLAEGNDGMTALTRAVKRECPEGVTLRDLFIQHVERQTAAGKPITSRLEGRIVMK